MRHVWVLILAGCILLPGCQAAENAAKSGTICDTECPPGTFQVESKEAAGGEAAGGSSGSGSANGYFGTYGTGKCEKKCMPPRPCCGKEKWGRDSYECEYPCAPGQVPGESNEGGNDGDGGEGGTGGEGDEGSTSQEGDEEDELGCGAGQTRCGAICCNPGEGCVNGGCCNRDCTSKQCGDDGCGGACGGCVGGTHCEANTCVPDEPLCENGGLRCDETCCEPGQGCVANTCCWPNCMDRECGDDGCGGLCGACEAQHACNEAGECICMPDCDGKNCGGDGCGGICGLCDTNEVCTPLGTCECPTDVCAGGCCPEGTVCNPGTGTCCTPKCAGKACGDNGCGGECGKCSKAQEECQNGECVCVPQCQPGMCGDDGCGGQCPCEANEVCGVVGKCECPTEVCQGLCCPSGKVCNPATNVCCTPQCTGRKCGDDGCGRPDGCGKCSGAQEQCQLGQCVCVPNCNGKSCGDDGCGGTCGSCPSGASCSVGQCVEIGCADGSREGLRNLAKFPTIAGCRGQTSAGYSLRDAKTGSTCGNDMPASYCGRPADVCADGWHVCGANGHPKDLSSRLSSWDCMNTDTSGYFAAAFSDDPDSCDALPALCNGYDVIGCGDESRAESSQCKDMIWPGATQTFGGPCDNFTLSPGDGDRGVLCCQDPALTGQ